ncbi:MAG: hypothetical protein AAF918_14585 [Pseudomonadota bacterium]
MDIAITKGRTLDTIEVSRPDGSLATTTFPKKGLFPHDAVHLVVESELQLTAGFWGRVAAGSAPEDIGSITSSGGHRSSSRAQTPCEDIVELIQAERLVECFEAEMWSERTDLVTFLQVFDAACAQSNIKRPKLSEQSVGKIRKKLDVLCARWQRLGIGESLVLFWR